MVQQAHSLPNVAADSNGTISKRTGFVTKALAGLVVIGLLLAMAMVGVIESHRTVVRKPDIEPPQQMLPGNPLPPDARCDWHMVTEPILYCNALNDGVTVHFSYDLLEHEITSTVVAVQNETIGQLILAWGIPTGFAKSVGTAEVYWGTRSAYLASLPFTPETHVGYIAYSLRPYAIARWHGATNRDDS